MIEKKELNRKDKNWCPCKRHHLKLVNHKPFKVQVYLGEGVKFRADSYFIEIIKLQTSEFTLRLSQNHRNYCMSRSHMCSWLRKNSHPFVWMMQIRSREFNTCFRKTCTIVTTFCCNRCWTHLTLVMPESQLFSVLMGGVSLGMFISNICTVVASLHSSGNE